MEYISLQEAYTNGLVQAIRGGEIDVTQLEGVNLTDTYLEHANLEGANLAGANLTGAHLYNTNLRGANLTGADMREAELLDTDFTGANMVGATLGEVENINITDAKMTQNEYDELLESGTLIGQPNIVEEGK